MWIDLIDMQGGEIPLHEVFIQIAERYDAALKAEMTELATDNFDFRHAVCIVDENGRHFKRCPKIEQLAGELLTEYGRARGGEPASWYVDQWDFDQCTGYSMTFIGGPTEPTFETRLKMEPAKGSRPLRDREEAYVYVPVAEGD